MCKCVYNRREEMYRFVCSRGCVCVCVHVCTAEGRVFVYTAEGRMCICVCVCIQQRGRLERGCDSSHISFFLKI